MVKVLRCPHCGSKNVKERIVTMDDFIDGAIRAVELGAKRIFTGKWEWQQTLNDINLDRATNPYKITKNHIDVNHVETLGIGGDDDYNKIQICKAWRIWM